MTICIATNIYYPSIGGIPNYYKYLAEILTSSGHNVIILTIDNSPIEAKDKIDEQGSVTTVTLRSPYLKYLSFYKNYFRPGSYTAYQWISMGYAMREWLLKNHTHYNIDIIETTDFGGAGIFLVEDRLPAVVIVGHSSASQISTHSYMKDDDHLKVIKQLEKLSFKYADAIVAHSPMNQQELRNLSGRDVYFARAPWMIPQKKVSPVSDQKIEYLVVSSLQMIKGAGIMAEAIRVTVRKKKMLKVYWVGADSHTAPGGERVSLFLEKNYPDIWNKNFIWIGEKEHQEVLDIISQSDVAIIPSLWETFNYFAIEAVFFERPLIITDNTGASYLFQNDKNTIIVPAESPGKLSEAILEQVSLLKEGKEEIDSNKEKIISYFSPARIMQDRQELYNACRANRSKNGNEAAESLTFISKYTTSGRRLYYLTRKKLKKIFKR